MRYAVTTSFYITATSEEGALKIAREMAKEQDLFNDDGCTVDEIREADFGKTDRKVIYSTKEKAVAETTAQ